MILKLMYIFGAYVLGSVLFSEISMRLFRHQSLMEVSANHNPGASNAFRYGGMLCGILAVLGDVGKGFLPVFFYDRVFQCRDIGLTLTMAAVAAGHAYSLFFRFRGGMCIAVSFGIFLGLLPQRIPLVTLVTLFLLLLLLHRSSNSVITIFAFTGLSAVCLFCFVIQKVDARVLLGVILISMLVCARMWGDLTEEEQQRLQKLVYRNQSGRIR